MTIFSGTVRWLIRSEASLRDESDEYFVYDGARHVCAATLDGMRERMAVLSGFSKTFSVTGWRVGYVTADARWLGAMSYFHDLTYVCAPSALQHGAARSCRGSVLPSGMRSWTKLVRGCGSFNR